MSTTPLPSRWGAASSRYFSAFRTAVASSPQTLSTTDTIQDAIEAACYALGRTPGTVETELIEKLQQNWFSTAADLASMTETQAAALGVPLKLKSWIDHALAPETDNQAQLLETTSSNVGIAIPPAAAALFQEQLSSSEVGVVDSNESSSGDTSDEYESSDEVDLAVGNTPESSVLTATTAASPTSLDKFIDQEGWEDLPIELRICPPLDRFGYDIKTRPNVVTRGRATKYALKLSEMPLPLQKEFEDLHKFGTQKFFGAQADPIAPVTALKYQDHLRGMLGWLHTVYGIPIDQLSLKNLLPTSERKSVSLAFDYCQWMVNERGVNVRTELLALRSILFAAKFLYHEESKVTLKSGDMSYSDLGVVKELRTLINTANKASKVAPRVADEAAKWLDWPEYLQLVQELRKECALLLPHNPRSPEKLERSRQQVAWSLQRYLIFAILACVPDRQRTLRELEVGRTLFKEGDRWIIRHGPGDYKTGKSYGERPPMVLNPTVYPELEAYVNTWRQELASPEHQRLFTQRNGGIFSDKQLSKFFMTSAYRLTGKRLTPHLIRDSIVTFLRKSEGISERELEALALYMGHSIEMQRSSYDRRTKEEKVGPAVALLETINQLASKYTN